MTEQGLIIVTGGFGFIGSHIIRKLNQCGFSNIMVVDNFELGEKFSNLTDCDITDYVACEDFYPELARGGAPFGQTNIQAIFHQGACTDTTAWDGRNMMYQNFTCSKLLLHYCLGRNIPFIYASSAAVYGGSQVFEVGDKKHERPLNIYGYSKYLFDCHVQSLDKPDSLVAGFRYFNVYGPKETHKKMMASTIYQFYQQLQDTDCCRLFGGSDGYADGEQQRDFIHVNDVANVCLSFFLDKKKTSGIFNLGTGKARSFNDVARILMQTMGGKRKIEYIPFPEKLRGHYQSFTEAGDMERIGQYFFIELEQGIADYVAWLRDDNNTGKDG